MASFNAILQRVGELVAPGFKAQESTGLTGTTVTDTKLITETGVSTFLQGYITRTAKDPGGVDRHRYIPAYASLTGQASSLATYTDTSDTTVSCLWWPPGYDPADIESFINRALENLYVEEAYDGLTTVTDQKQYALTSQLAWVTEPEQVKAVYILDGTSGKYTERLIRGARVHMDEEVATLDFSRASHVPSATDVVRIISTRPYSSIGTHPIVTGAGTTLAPLELVAWKAAEYLFEKRVLMSPLEGRKTAQEDLQWARARVSEELAKHPSHRHESSAFKPPRAGGWMLRAG